MKPRLPVRDASGADRFQLFLVSSVLTIAVTRIFLAATGFPQLGGGGLHLAHLLWGGLGMLVSQLLFMLFFSRAVRKAATILGGVGFGLFIDEVGKFVTGDNNYFYEPVAAIIYGTFLAAYLLVALAVNRRPLTERERVANAVELLKDAVIEDATDAERDRIVQLVRSAGDPESRAAPLPSAGDRQPPPHPPRSALARMLAQIQSYVTRALDARGAERAVVAAIGLLAVFSLGRPLVLLSRAPGPPNVVYAASAVISLIFTATGVWWWARGPRLRSLGSLEVALVVQLLVVQFFWLLDHEFAGFPLVLGTLVLLKLCRSLAARDRVRAAIALRVGQA